ncbi:MAG: hypothetical protein KA447_12520 [Pyrinomonadaceae bacterium]|nr:hypothetical protein [Pyrinomonadaceae bacterium]
MPVYLTPMCIIRIIFLTLLGFAIASAQSAVDLRKKFGEPTSESRSETYQIKPYDKKTNTSVQLTVTYAKTGEITEWLVEIFPYFQDRQTPVSEEESDTKIQILRDALAEVFPLEKRGKNIINGFLSGTCSDDDCYGTFERYENVTIFFNGNNHRYARIRTGSDFVKKIPSK